MLRWLALALVTLLALAAGAIALLDRKTHKVPAPPRPGAFYRAPDPLPHGPPGTMVRQQRLAGLPLGERGWRILYVSHGYDGRRIAVSGLVIAPVRTSRHHRRIVVFAHGTTGIASRCGPSVFGAAAAPQIDGLRSFIHAGDAVVVPDYQGLGTPGPHPYLVGKTAARNVIDAARAIRKIAAVHAGRHYAVFGDTQGAQAAIAVGQLAPHYGAGLQLVGIVAAGAPISLAGMFSRGQGTTVGDVLAAYTLSSWAKVYGETKLNDVVTRAAQPALRSIGASCVTTDTDLADVVPDSVVKEIAYTHRHPTHSKAWSALLRQNSLRPFETPVPLLIVQGGKDELVPPSATEDYIRALCERADTVDYRVYPSATHDAVGPSSAHFSVGWIAGRFAGRRPRNSCPGGP